MFDPMVRIMYFIHTVHKPECELYLGCILYFYHHNFDEWWHSNNNVIKLPIPISIFSDSLFLIDYALKLGQCGGVFNNDEHKWR